MYLEKLVLTNFRNYKNQEIIFNRGINLFIGDNAQGKTNIVEAIYTSAFSKSYRASKDIELINFDEEYTKVMLYYNKNNNSKTVDIYIDKNKKVIKLDEIKIKKMTELIGEIPLVIFSPEDMQIVKGASGEKRKFIDMICCQLSLKYLISFTEYNKCLKIKNNLLKKELKIEDKEYIYILNEKMSPLINYICNYRKEIILKLSNYSKLILKEITENKEDIDVIYTSDFENMSSIDINNKLNSVLNYEIIRKTTLKGITKDNIEININKKEVNKYGSQGQKRTSLLALKLANFEILRELKKEEPILLLDDIMSELDKKRVDFLLKYIEKYQSIITTTDYDKLSEKIEKIKIEKIKNGSLQN